MYVCVPCLSLVLVETRRWYQIPWKLNSRLHPTTWVLEPNLSLLQEQQVPFPLGISPNATNWLLNVGFIYLEETTKGHKFDNRLIHAELNITFRKMGNSVIV